MPLLVFFGCMFIAFGPSLAMFLLTIVKFPLRIILLIVGAFFWLLALLFSALLWIAVVPLKEELAFSLVFSVLFQELARFGLYKLMNKAEDGLGEALSDEEKQSIAGHKLSYVSGLGFGLMSGTFSVVNVLSNSIGPGNVGICSSSTCLSKFASNFFMISAFLASGMILLHTFWNVILFNAFQKKKWHIAAIVVGFHMLISCMSLLNADPNHDINFVSLIVLYVVLLISTVWAYSVVKSKATLV